MKRDSFVVLFSALIGCGLTAPLRAGADSAPVRAAETLAAGWEAQRKALYDHGVEIGLTHKSDVLSNLSGGLRRGTAWLGHTGTSVALDMDRLLGWDATTAYVDYHSNLGSKFNTRYVGAFMGVDNIEVASNTGQFYHAWIQKTFLDERLSVLTGLYPIDSEFYVTNASGVFLQPPYGMANEIAQTGRNGPAIFPMAALAVRVKYTGPGRNWYAQGALTDGVPGDPDNGRGTHIKLGRGDGTFAIAEAGYTPQDQSFSGQADAGATFNKAAIGVWRYSGRFDDLADQDAGGNPVPRRSRGVYVLVERMLHAESRYPSQGLAGFARFGTASPHIHQASWTSSIGLRYRGLFTGRDEDIAGLAVTLNHAGGKYRRLNNASANETDIELTYRAQVRPWMAVQPTLQYIIRPGMDTALRNALVIGFRTEISFRPL